MRCSTRLRTSSNSRPPWSDQSFLVTAAFYGTLGSLLTISLHNVRSVATYTLQASRTPIHTSLRRLRLRPLHARLQLPHRTLIAGQQHAEGHRRVPATHPARTLNTPPSISHAFRPCSDGRGSVRSSKKSRVKFCCLCGQHDFVLTPELEVSAAVTNDAVADAVELLLGDHGSGERHGWCGVLCC